MNLISSFHSLTLIEKEKNIEKVTWKPKVGQFQYHLEIYKELY